MDTRVERLQTLNLTLTLTITVVFSGHWQTVEQRSLLRSSALVGAILGNAIFFINCNNFEKRKKKLGLGLMLTIFEKYYPLERL